MLELRFKWSRSS